MTRGASRLFAAVLSAVALLFAIPAVASAEVFVVNTTADSTPDQSCVGVCTLREAVDLAGLTDSISVPAGTYVIAGELTLDGDTLTGAGARSTIIDANHNGRVMSTSNFGTPSSVTGVTIRNGQTAQPGAGISVSGTLRLINSHVVGNTTEQDGGGIIVESGSRLELTGSTVAGNTAQGATADGGGIYMIPETELIVLNSTISDNTASATTPGSGRGGGIFGDGYVLELANVTLAYNTASAGGGVYGGALATTFTNSILADNTGGSCGGGTVLGAASHHNLATDGSCAMTGPGNLQGVGALIGGLANNGGPTDTRALAAGSPAVNAGSGCTNSDQRGIARPQGSACDIGAFEYVPPVLTVTTTVINRDGGEDRPADFTVHVRDGAGGEVGGSPQPGSAAGTAFTLVPGSFRVSADGANLYTITIGGACTAAGDVAVAENQSVTCTVTANDRAPRAGREVGAIPAGGTVRIKKPGGRFRVLREADMLPNGTTVDTLKGRITLIAAANRSGRETKADFYDGVFKLRQSKGRRPITTLTLTEKLSCPKAGSAIAAAKKKKRRLWGNGSGRFRTKGKHSAATVPGTKWLVEDRCTSTLTRVVRGRVSVRDFVKKKTVMVRAGKRYVAQAD